jgi:deoxyribodipyrimidine photo-lyase
MVDACMRSLVATGWLNFRMRAMLMSFASYHLWLHWRGTAPWLGAQFLDF